MTDQVENKGKFPVTSVGSAFGRLGWGVGLGGGLRNCARRAHERWRQIQPDSNGMS